MTDVANVKSEFGKNIFQKTTDDKKIGLSVDDHDFLEIMDSQFHKDSKGYWEAPLPFQKNRKRLANNHKQALNRAKQFSSCLMKDETKRQHVIEFMDQLIQKHHAEVAPPISSDEECWYLPLFGVYHPKKPKKIRLVFDSSSKCEGQSLNDVLLSGPDLTNSLLGVLMRFRREEVAIMADVEQMFYCFRVNPAHRNFLRFLWHEDNDVNKPLIEYRMTVHVFGNSPSPAIATYGMRRTVKEVEHIYGTDVTHYIERDFYVDDGLTSQQSVKDAVDLMKRTHKALSLGKLRLHKIASNNSEVMKSFDTEDLSSDLKIWILLLTVYQHNGV